MTHPLDNRTLLDRAHHRGRREQGVPILPRGVNPSRWWPGSELFAAFLVGNGAARLADAGWEQDLAAALGAVSVTLILLSLLWVWCHFRVVRRSSPDCPVHDHEWKWAVGRVRRPDGSLSAGRAFCDCDGVRDFPEQPA